MKNYLKKHQHAQWGTIIGYEKDIRLAALKDEIELFRSRSDSSDTGHLHITISVLEHRIKELS
jgi:hypothetical protein